MAHQHQEVREPENESSCEKKNGHNCCEKPQKYTVMCCMISTKNYITHHPNLGSRSASTQKLILGNVAHTRASITSFLNFFMAIKLPEFVHYSCTHSELFNWQLCKCSASNCETIQSMLACNHYALS